MLDRGALFLKKLEQSRGKIAKNAAKFVIDGCVSSQNEKLEYLLLNLIYCSKYLLIQGPEWYCKL